jgi:hypothetical protein
MPGGRFWLPEDRRCRIAPICVALPRSSPQPNGGPAGPTGTSSPAERGGTALCINIKVS